MRVCTWICTVSLGGFLAACAGSGPYRDARLALGAATAGLPSLTSPADDCADVYVRSDQDIREVASNFSYTDSQRNDRLKVIQREIKQSYGLNEQRHCWDTAHEHHPDYELFYTEFDDAGQAVDRVKGAKFEESELYLIEKYLKGQLNSDSAQGLNIVVFSHGWHGSARASDTYSLEFKGILQNIARIESSYASATGAQRPSGPFFAARTHRVVGIEIAWRGDSLLFPKFASVWDRKLAAETVSIGAVHELFAFLNQTYLDNSCHSGNENYPPQRGPCDRVHLLTIGHSFGALINFRSLIARLQSGINVDPCYRAYGFGDMTILLNPAFESARYRSLFNQGLSRHVVLSEFYGDPELDQNKCPPPTAPKAGTIPKVQIPTMVTLQSQGDTATGVFFPLFRHLTTVFAKALTPEESRDKNTAIGWNDDFRTHKLSLPEHPPIDADRCISAMAPAPNAPAQAQVAYVNMESAPTATPDKSLTFCPFISENPTQADSPGTQADTHLKHMLLEYSPGTTKQLPNYLPFWSIEVSKDIMKNHDDFWNAQTTRLISILFEDAYEQTENIHRGGIP